MAAMTVQLTDTRLPALRVNDFYAKMSRDKSLDEKTREFLQKNIRSATWLMEAIEQRKNTLLRVARSIVEHQKEFLEKGQLFLKPLPMSTVAARGRRAYRHRFAGGGGQICAVSAGCFAAAGVLSAAEWKMRKAQSRSWDAVRARMQQIVDAEDKSNPFNDDEIKQKLEEAGFKDLARRTVAKYRKLLNIPAVQAKVLKFIYCFETKDIISVYSKSQGSGGFISAEKPCGDPRN